MKYTYFTLLLLIPCFLFAQQKSFPQSWEGNWKGVLSWYKTGKTDPQEVNMELRIHPTDSAGTWTWQLVYGSVSQDNRPYKLIAKDSSGTHWVVDENNGIVLDQYWVANKLCGMFTVQSSTIINNYWIENGKLMIEFYSVSAKPIATTGHDTDESPTVDSYKIGSYQKAILQRSE